MSKRLVKMVYSSGSFSLAKMLISHILKRRDVQREIGSDTFGRACTVVDASTIVRPVSTLFLCYYYYIRGED